MLGVHAKMKHVILKSQSKVYDICYWSVANIFRMRLVLK